MTWNRGFCLIAIASAGVMLSAPIASAQSASSFGFNIMEMDRASGSPWLGLPSYTFQSPDRDSSKSITVTALSLKSSGRPVTLSEGVDSAGSIGVLANGDDEQKTYLSEALHIRLGQQASKVELTLKDLHALDRQVLWTVSGKDAKGRTVIITGNIQGRGVANDESEVFVIDQDTLTATRGQPAGGFTGPVAIEEITLSSLHEFATLPQFGNIRFDQSFLLVGVQAYVGDEGDDDDDDNAGPNTNGPPNANADDDDDNQ
jgi:hypothetical protein